LNETELALQREEIARKMKSLSEKKLVDEKVFSGLVLISGRQFLTTRIPNAKMTQEECLEGDGDDEEEWPMDIVEEPP